MIDMFCLFSEIWGGHCERREKSIRTQLLVCIPLAYTLALTRAIPFAAILGLHPGALQQFTVSDHQIARCGVYGDKHAKILGHPL